MFDVFTIIAFIIGVFGLAFILMYIFNSDVDAPWYVGIILLILTLILYIAISMNVGAENYVIDKNTIKMERIDFKNIHIIFPDTLNVEVIEYDVSLSAFWDYKIYRIYIDSVRYIEIFPAKYDSLDIQVGTKLFEDKND